MAMKVELEPFVTSQGEEIPQSRVIVERELPNGKTERRQQAWYMHENQTLVFLGDCTLLKSQRVELKTEVEKQKTVSTVAEPPAMPSDKELKEALKK